MTLKKNYIAIAFLIAAGVVSPMAAAMQPLTCEVLEEKRTSSIETAKERIEQMPEYDEQYEEVEAKNECMADVGEVMSANVGASNVLGKISDLLGDKLSNKVCEAAKKKAKEATEKAAKKAQDKVDDAMEKTGEFIGKYGKDGDLHQPSPIHPSPTMPTYQQAAPAPSISNTNNGNTSRSAIYDQLGSMF